MASCTRNKDESSPRLLSVCASPARNDGLRIHNMRILYSICRLLDYFHLAGVRIYFYCCFFSGNGVAGNLISFCFALWLLSIYFQSVFVELSMPRHQLKHLPKMVMAWYTYHVAVTAVSEFVRLVRMNVSVKQNLYVAINTKVHFILILLLI
jgi:hypothetical protein